HGHRPGRGHERGLGHAAGRRRGRAVQGRAARHGDRRLSLGCRRGEARMSPAEFDYLCALVKERSGLVLTKDKGYLLENRLMPVARKRSIASLKGLVAALKAGDRTLAAEVVDAMTTN